MPKAGHGHILEGLFHGLAGPASIPIMPVHQVPVHGVLELGQAATPAKQDDQRRLEAFLTFFQEIRDPLLTEVPDLFQVLGAAEAAVDDL
jgi:hypothetical protein